MNPYEVLGVPKAATSDDIKKAYRGKAMIFHPDKSPDDPKAEANFKKINQAYEILSDPGKRARFDRGGNASSQHADFFNDVMSHMKTAGWSSMHTEPNVDSVNRFNQPKNISVHARVTLVEAMLGCEKEVTYDRMDSCRSCSGNGGQTFKRCDACLGSGQRTMRSGPMLISTSCNVCLGGGMMIDKKCDSCLGTGACPPKKVTKKIQIPKGMRTGIHLHFAGEGEPSRAGGGHGHLYVVVLIEDNPLFKVDGDNLMITVPVGFSQLVQGCTLGVPTVTGEQILMDIPQGSTSLNFCISGKGLPIMNTDRCGDLIVQLFLDVPQGMGEDYWKHIHALGEFERSYPGPKKKLFEELIKTCK